ncbi:sialate O-acetylesterase [Pedobacter aquatilis]|uniref:sialate O-acetylesterase n=1 Tax=Pedobacter aquatilis TaxID=351343 RepID=UPI00292E07DB|nr:sialate O-acetylesterase [Pedobacter aquatilis]
MFYQQFNFKRIAIFLLLGLSAFATRKANLIADSMDVYILMGQSNMAGRGVISAGDSLVKNNKVMMFSADLKWLPAKNPLHFDKPGILGVGPGLSFGLVLPANHISKTIGLVPTAVGGTSIDVWKPEALDKNTKKYPYDDAVKRIVAAMKTGIVKGVLWHQGESDSEEKKAVAYLPKLILLIKRIRNLTGNPNLPFVVGELGHYNPAYGSINKELAKLPGKVPFTAVVSAEGLCDKGDGIHFNTASADLLGQRFAEKMLELEKL